MSCEVAAISLQLAQAVELMMNPAVPQQQRQQAYQQLEEFKEKSPFGSQCGFFLSTTNNSEFVRHFGLKILEDIVKARWNSMAGEEKFYIKESLMKLVASGTRPILQEQNHIKDALAKIIVELIKREWPQHWPSLLSELDNLCRMGETQAELVMFILLRLVEDVAVLQTLEQAQRRKEIYSALTSNMEEIFGFLLGLLSHHYQAYLAKKGILKGAEHSKVCMSILNTFTSLVEWVPIQHIMANQRYLLSCLAHLLSDDQLQMYAADCLLGVVNWRAGKMSDRAQLLCLFDMEMMGPLFVATEAAEKRALEENHYNFLKKMVQVFAGLGEQLCHLTTKETPRQVPNLRIYLNALLAFTRHPSQTVNLIANEVWSKFFRHVELSAIPIFVAFQGDWLRIAVKQAVRVGNPYGGNGQEKHPACQYNLLDFDDEEEFVSFFNKYRLCILETVRQIALSDPVTPLDILAQWLKEALSSGRDPYPDVEAISALLESVYAKIITTTQLRPLSSTTAELMQICLDYKTEDPKLLSHLLSCISAMFVVVLDCQQALNPILQKIFSALATDTLLVKSKDVRTLRRHSCALLIRLSTKFPAVMLSTFEYLQAEITALQTQNLLSRMEVVTLLESLIIISNQIGHYERQADFLAKISAPFVQQFQALQPQYSSVSALISHIGGDLPPPEVDPTHTVDGLKTADVAPGDQIGQNRATLIALINLLLAVSRRAEAPAEPNILAGGGFNMLYGGKMVTRNPAGGVLLAVLPNLLQLCQTLNIMLSQAGSLHPGYAKACDLLEVDKNNILGLPGSRTAKNELTYGMKVPEPVVRMQHFVTELFENAQHLLSYLCSNIGYEFYMQPGLADVLCQTVLANLEGLPDFRLRAINRMFLKTFINKCPVEFLQPMALPILQKVVPYMVGRLQERWAYLAKLRQDPTFDENNTDSQEVLDDVVITVSTREYLDTLKAALTSGGGLDSPAKEEKETSNLTLSVLGEMVLSDPGLSRAVTLTCLRALNWTDSPSGTRAAALLEIIIPKIYTSGTFNQEAANMVMIEVLSGFQEMGMHEANNIALTHLALNCYTILRPAYPGVVHVLAQVPGCNLEDLQKFDAKIVSDEPATVGEKARKDMFKKLISQLVAKDVARLFQKEIVIKNLPNLQPTKVRPKTASLDEQTEGDGSETGLTALFS